MDQTLEQQILTELADIKENQAFMRVMLLGGTYREVVYDGKVPMVDAMIKLLDKQLTLLDKRIEMLEADRTARDATLRATKWICGILAGSGVLGTVLSNLLLRH